MTSASQPPDAATLEQLIYQVRGIQAARVVTGQSGVIDEVHVVSLPGRSPKQMVRDIESILYVRGGVRLDHRKVSLVQLDERRRAPQGPRLVLQAVCYEADGPSVEVTLGLHERQARGVCSDPSVIGGAPLGVTAQATLSALATLVGGALELRLEQIALHDFGGLRSCLSQVSLTTESGAETLLGISMLRDDVPAAAARAVLDAVNRPLLRLLAYDE